MASPTHIEGPVGFTAIGEVRDRAGSFVVGDGQPGPVTRRLRRALLDVQLGPAADPRGWRSTVPVAS